jgi:L-2,4-diaminobutyrate decarboxylase
MTLQCSRRFDALKLWVTLQHYGADHFAGLQETTVRTTQSLHAKLAAAPDFEPEHAPESNILCFRHLSERGDDFQAELRRRYNESGAGWITTTVLDGRRVLRVTLINPHTADEHLDRLLDGLREVGRGIA